MQRLKYVALFTALAVTGPASAGLLGQQVTGSLIFQGDPANYFDPTNFFNGPLPPPPPDYLNNDIPVPPGGSTVTIQDPAIEFGFDDGFETYSADFTDTTLTIDYLIYSDQVVSAVPFTMTFTLDPGRFILVTKNSDTFNPLVTCGPTSSTTCHLDSTGKTLTIDWGGIPETPGQKIPPQDFTATFSIESESQSVPEPSILALMSLGLAGIGVVKRRRVPAASA